MPRYDRNASFRGSTMPQENDSVFDDDRDALQEAAQALREAEVEAVQPTKRAYDHSELEALSIDDLRALAAKLQVPDRGTITEKSALIAEIRKRT